MLSRHRSGRPRSQGLRVSHRVMASWPVPETKALDTEPAHGAIRPPFSGWFSDFSRGRSELIDEGDLSLAAVGQPLVFQAQGARNPALAMLASRLASGSRGKALRENLRTRRSASAAPR